MKEVVELPLGHIEANRFNPNVMDEATFQALKVDVISGDYEPIVISPKNVFYMDPELPRDRYIIVDGEHRWRAAVEAALGTIDVDVRGLTESEARSFNYRRNRERGMIDPLKEASLFKSEVDEGLTHEQIAEKYVVSRTYVTTRLSLLKLDEEVKEIYRRPKEKFKERKEAEHNLRLEQAREEDVDWVSEPQTVPRGTITPSHLEVIAILPKEEQVKVAVNILEEDLSVRGTERSVKRLKTSLEKELRFKEALEKAKRKKCPQCGSDPKGFSYRGEEWFRCSDCWHDWEYMKTRAEVEAERKAKQTEEEREEAERRKERFKEARENPSYIRLPQTPEELDALTRPWLLRKIQQLTEVEKVEITGKRGNEKVILDYTPRYGTFYRMALVLRVEDPESGALLSRFGFNVEEKVYKRTMDRSRVNITWGEVSEETREQLKRFFSETVQTDRDPWEEVEVEI